MYNSCAFLPPSPLQTEALRSQLDERMRAAAAAGPELSSEDLSYGSEVWSRCEALVSGLAGELTEQLRLILEPTLASKLAGDYRTGGSSGLCKFPFPSLGVSVHCVRS